MTVPASTATVIRQRNLPWPLFQWRIDLWHIFILSKLLLTGLLNARHLHAFLTGVLTLLVPLPNKFCQWTCHQKNMKILVECTSFLMQVAKI